MKLVGAFASLAPVQSVTLVVTGGGGEIPSNQVDSTIIMEQVQFSALAEIMCAVERSAWCSRALVLAAILQDLGLFCLYGISLL